MNNKKITIFLGAGASKADNAPLQGDMFKEYFLMRFEKLSERQNKAQCVIENLVRDFFKKYFKIAEINKSNLDKLNFPTFEEVLGFIYTSKNKFEKYSEEVIINDYKKINISIKNLFEFLMADLLEYKLQRTNNFHALLVSNLRDYDVSYISTNYDILIDKALMYNIKSPNYNSLQREDNSSGPSLYKLHGSLNWLFCPYCKRFEIDRYNKIMSHMLWEGVYKCDCQNNYNFLIIPPTYFKDFKNPILKTIWSQCEKDLSQSEHIIFCGYSFPDADIHVKTLLLDALSNGTDRKITIINGVKELSVQEQERKRFERVLGKINYTNYDFQTFAKTPYKLLDSLL